MKKILIISIFFFFNALNAQTDEIKRILVGNKSAKISIIAFESKDIATQLLLNYNQL